MSPCMSQPHHVHLLPSSLCLDDLHVGCKWGRLVDKDECVKSCQGCALAAPCMLPKAHRCAGRRAPVRFRPVRRGPKASLESFHVIGEVLTSHKEGGMQSQSCHHVCLHSFQHAGRRTPSCCAQGREVEPGWIGGRRMEHALRGRQQDRIRPGWMHELCESTLTAQDQTTERH